MPQKGGYGNQRNGIFTDCMHGPCDRECALSNIGGQCQQASSFAAGAGNIGSANIAATVFAWILTGQPARKNQPERDGAKQVSRGNQDKIFEAQAGCLPLLPELFAVAV